MKTLSISTLVILSVFFCGITSGQAADGKRGNIRVLKVQGDVITINTETKESTPLKEGEFLQQGQEVKAGNDSSSILLFSNGTTLTVEENTTFAVEEFLQNPFDSKEVAYQRAKEEPSISQTKVHVSEGSVVADITKLKKGSHFSIGTPVGTAGIRGTIIRVVVTPAGGGNPTSATIDLPEGEIEFETLDGKTFTLSDGTTITIEAIGNKLTPGDVTPMSDAEESAIAKMVDEALALIPPGGVFDGVLQGSPELLGGGTDEFGGTGNFGGDQGAGTTGLGGFGGSGGGSGNGDSSPTPSPTPIPLPPPAS